MFALTCLAAVAAGGPAAQAAAQSGKAARNLPYRPIEHPQFVRAAQARFLGPHDLLIGVANGPVAKAYPAAILAQHGLVQDRMPDGAIVVTWCTWCNTAVVFRNDARGKILHFYTVGVRGSSEVFADRETGSRWQQAALRAISGPMQGTRLAMYPFLLTSWREWRKQHPNTLVLKPLPGYAARLAERNKIINQGIVGMAGPAPFAVLRDDRRLPPRATVVGLISGGVAKAYPIAALQKTRVVNDRVGGRPVLVVHQPASDTTTAFVAQVQGKTLRFRAADPDAGRLTDLATHSIWNAYGLCLAGRLKGTRLRRLLLQPGFWFAWSEFHPGTGLYAARR